jgi:hypothetical protein
MGNKDMAIAESIRRSPVGRRTVLVAATLQVLDLGNPGSVFRRRTHLFDVDVFALGFIRGTDARVLFRKRGIPASMTPRPPGKEEEEPDGLSALGGCHGGQRDAGRDDKRSGDSQCSDHACSPCGGNQINGQKIPASRLALDMDAPQHQQGRGEVFQQL